jgi:hypothetical protein
MASHNNNPLGDLLGEVLGDDNPMTNMLAEAMHKSLEKEFTSAQLSAYAILSAACESDRVFTAFFEETQKLVTEHGEQPRARKEDMRRMLNSHRDILAIAYREDIDKRKEEFDI